MGDLPAVREVPDVRDVPDVPDVRAPLHYLYWLQLQQ